MTPEPPPASVAIGLGVDALATYRLTRLATKDVLTEPMRRSIIGRRLGWTDEQKAACEPTAEEAVEVLEDPPKLVRLITCRWCAGVWIAGGVVAARLVAPKLWDPVAKGLAFSSVAVLLSGFEGD